MGKKRFENEGKMGNKVKKTKKKLRSKDVIRK